MLVASVAAAPVRARFGRRDPDIAEFVDASIQEIFEVGGRYGTDNELGPRSLSGSRPDGRASYCENRLELNRAGSRTLAALSATPVNREDHHSSTLRAK